MPGSQWPMTPMRSPLTTANERTERFCATFGATARTVLTPRGARSMAAIVVVFFTRKERRCVRE